MQLIKASFDILESQGYLEDIEIAGRTCYKSNPQYEYFDLTDRPNEPIERYVNCEINISKEEAFDRGLVIRRSTTAKEFVEKMIKSGHGAMLEHGTVYLKILHIDKYSCSLTKYENNKYSKYKSLYADKDDVQGDITYYSDYYVTTNYRVLLENGWLDDLQYLCEPTEYHEKRTTVRFICDRGVSHEFVRHKNILCVA